MRGNDFRFNGVVRLTRIGAGYIVFTFLIAFAALNTGNNSLYIGLSFMLGALLISGVASKGGLRHLEVKLYQVDQAWAGMPVHGMLHVENNSRLWNVRDVVISSDETDRPALLAILDRRTGTDVPVSFVFSRRGRAELKRVDLYTRYPFALFLKKRKVPITASLIVYPRLIEAVTPFGSNAPDPGQLLQSNRAGEGTELFGFKDYIRGDSVRRIHWKKSASLGRWILKESESEIDRSVHLFVDTYLPAGRSAEEFETMISVVATLAWDLLREQTRVTLTAGGRSLTASDEQNARGLFETLALLESSPEPGTLPDETEIMVFSLRRR